MRLKDLYIISLALAALAVCSCQKELSYEGGAPITGSSGPLPDSIPAVSSADTMRVTVNAMPWVAQTFSASIISGVSAAQELEITGSSAAGAPTVGLVMPANLSVGGPYDFVINNVNGIYLPLTSTFLQSTTGQITILENNPTTLRVRGNFQFEAVDPTGAVDSVKLTLGYFSVKYTP
jgi:hypothetical protein